MYVILGINLSPDLYVTHIYLFPFFAFLISRTKKTIFFYIFKSYQVWRKIFLISYFYAGI